MTSTSQPGHQRRPGHQFTHPDVGVLEGGQRRRARHEAEAEERRRGAAVAKTSVLVLNGNGVAGSAANGSYLLRQQGYVTVLPPGNALAERADARATSTPRSTTTTHQTGAQAAARRAREAVRPGRRRPAAEEPRSCARSTRGRCSSSSSARRSTTSSSRPPPAPPAADARPAVRALRRDHRPRPARAARAPVPFTLEVPTVLEAAPRTRRPVRRHRGAALLDRQGRAREGGPARLRRPAPGRVLGDRGDRTCRTRRCSPTGASSTAQGPRVPALLLRLEPAHGRAARRTTAATGSSTRCSTRSRTRR